MSDPFDHGDHGDGFDPGSPTVHETPDFNLEQYNVHGEDYEALLEARGETEMMTAPPPASSSP